MDFPQFSVKDASGREIVTIKGSNNVRIGSEVFKEYAFNIVAGGGAEQSEGKIHVDLSTTIKDLHVKCKWIRTNIHSK